MTCCSGRRAALNRGTGLRAAGLRTPATTQPATPADGTVALAYTGPLPMLLPSPSGAAPYTLDRPGQVLGVAAGDVAALLLTGWFAAV